MQLLGFCLILFVMIGALTAFTAGISISNTSLGVQASSVSANQVKPDACASLNLTNIVSGAGTVTGTAGNDLILGSSGADTIDSLGGDDCLLGGGGDDTIDGNTGADICLGGPGTDAFTACESEIQ
jgi:Ca2+-binding RTX toxin-like protein